MPTASQLEVLRIATAFENRLDPEKWHERLIQRMAMDVPRIRPAVIDRELVQPLHALRSFRHFFRHSYASELDWDKLKLVLRDLDVAEPQVRSALAQFVAYLAELGRECKESQP